MRKPRLYLETSVWNFAFADDALEKKSITLKFFETIKRGDYKIFISDIVIQEIERADNNKRYLLQNIIDEYNPEVLPINEEIIELTEKYVSEGILSTDNIADATHAAIATVYELDALISWNLKHLANLRRMEMINGINMKVGYYKRLELVTPMEVSYGEV
jgi:predicted nucleic acid-binding protein